VSAYDGADGVDSSGFPTVGGIDAFVRRGRLLALIEGDGTTSLSTATPDRAGARRAGGGPRGLLDRLDRLDRLCAAAVTEIGVDGAGITVMGSLEDGLNGERDRLAATEGLARRLDELQLTAGEGPCLDAYLRGRPVLVGDLRAESGRWLGFGPEALRLGAAALFSLPLQVGAVRLGTFDLYRATPGELSRDQLADAFCLASLATEVLLELAEQPDPGSRGNEVEREADIEAVRSAGWLPGVHADVHMAAGMLSARADVAVATALLRLRAHAFAHGEPLHEVARRVIAHDLVLDGLEEPAESGPRGDHDASNGHPTPGPENEEP
jgi:hypothetical protein